MAEHKRNSARGGSSGPNSSRGKGGPRAKGAPQGKGLCTKKNPQNNHKNSRGNKQATHKQVRLDQPRRIALEVLTAVRADQAYANLLLPKLLKKANLQGRDAAFATELTYGTLRAEGLLDLILSDVSTRPLTEIDPPLLDVLRLGTYQLLRTRVGAHAAVDTSVQAAKIAGAGSASGFVNGLLRTIARSTPEEWVAKVAPDAQKDPIGHVATVNAHPRWIAEAFALSLGPDAGELPAALAADDARPIVHLVARPGEITAEELALITGGEQGRYSPYCVHLESGSPGDLEPVKQGLAAVQDEGSQLIARAVVTAEVSGTDNGRWLDLCSGPGGKTAFIGSIAAMDNATVDAVEVSEKRAGLVQQATRGLPVTVHVTDGRDTGLEPGFDRILVDAPCSGLGSLRRRPEARWRKSAKDIPELTKLQFELLMSAWQLVRPGGIIVYSTCSPHLRETRGIVDKAVRTLGAVEVDAHALVPGMENVGQYPSVQMWPHRHGTDAMFFAVLQKPAD